ncbi:MAG TPA: hypothetical protein VEI94_00640 [Candidatus Bathyarchaeia archaeon]|nr:hypothetical protein [Candidatus Bathyarchaeia archaeon]
MSRFVIGLLLGLLLGIAGTSAFLITAGGGDYLISSSPRVRELEATLKEAEKEREGLSKRLDQFTDMTTRLESRFIALGARFEALAKQAGKEPDVPSDHPTPPAAEQ